MHSECTHKASDSSMHSECTHTASDSSMHSRMYAHKQETSTCLFTACSLLHYKYDRITCHLAPHFWGGTRVMLRSHTSKRKRAPKQAIAVHTKNKQHISKASPVVRVIRASRTIRMKLIFRPACYFSASFSSRMTSSSPVLVFDVEAEAEVVERDDFEPRIGDADRLI